MSRLADKLAEGIHALLPPGAAQDVERNLRAMVESTLARMDVVTREEFDRQQAVLRRTRERLEALQERVRELEGGTDKE